MSEGQIIARWTAGFVFVAVFVVATIYVGVNIKRIEPGEVGIQVSYGNRDIKALSQGYTFEHPRERIVQFSVAQQTIKELAVVENGEVVGGNAVKCQDQNGIPLYVDVTTLWRVDPAEVEELFLLRPGRTEIEQIQDDVVDRDVEKAITNACSRFSYYDVYSAKRGEFIQTAADNLKSYIQDSPRGHLLLDDLNIGQTHLEKTQRDAIAAVDTARQAAKTAEENVRKSEFEAQSKVAESEGQRQSAILAAEGRAEAKRIDAEGEAESISIIQEQLAKSPDYLDYLIATQWNGQMPYVTGDADGTLFQLPAPAR